MKSKFLESSEAFEELSIRSQIGIMAYHGGTLEKATDVIARETAEQTDASYYGLIQTNDDPLHNLRTNTRNFQHPRHRHWRGNC